MHEIFVKLFQFYQTSYFEQNNITILVVYHKSIFGNSFN